MATKFTPENRGALLERFAAGVSQADACRVVGVREPTLKMWLTKGRKGQEPYADFAAAVDKARQEVKDRPEPMDEEELFRVVSETARKGSVQAMKLRWEMICASRKPAEPEVPQADPLGQADELAARRAA